MNIPKWLHQVIYEKKYRLVKHLLFWLFVYADEFLSFVGLTESFEIPFYVTLLSMGFDMFLVYFNIYYLVPKLFNKGRLILYLLITFLSITLISALNYNLFVVNDFFYETEMPIESNETEIPDSNLPDKQPEATLESLEEEYEVVDFMTYFMGFLILTSGILGLAVAMKLLEASYRSSLSIQKLKESNLKTELAYLKTQVNPHFLFNTLNNMYIMSRKKDENVPETIMQLSDLLRYQLYECDADTVPLKNEINYINNYIELEQLRTQNLDIDMQVVGDPLMVQIRPLIFLPFIENAFKYSKTDGGQDYIKILFDASKENLIFKCINNKGTLKSGDVGGIGLTNATRRLELSYPKKHTLDIKDENGEFEVHVQIDLT